MDWQPIATGLVVGIAALYLVRKIGGFGRRRTRKRSGPDVPLASLKRKSSATTRSVASRSTRTTSGESDSGGPCCSPS